MKNIFTCFFLSFLSITSLPACDLCNMYECNAYQNRSYISLFYRYRTFNGYNHLANHHTFFTAPDQIGANKRIMHEPNGTNLLVNKSKNDYERYFTYEFRGNLSIKKKINIQFIIPFRRNEVYYKQVMEWPNPEKDSLMKVQGWGDLMLATDYVKFFQKGRYKHFFRPGFAVKLPTGSYNKRGFRNNVYDPTIQTGTGAFDFLLRFNYQLAYRNFGLNSSINYKISTKGRNSYIFGNTINFYQDIYYQLHYRDLTIVPKTGVYIEQAEKDKWKEQTQQGTGGVSLFANAGTDFNYKSITLQLLFQKPLSERLNSNQIGNAGRITLGIIYSF